jgi:group I intron endonuclease
MKNLEESIKNRQEKIIGIYKIISPTGKIYIGQSIDIKKRIGIYKNGWTHSQPKLHRSFEKHGFMNHIFEIIEKCSIDILDERETFYKTQIIESLGWEKALFCDLHDQGTGPRSEETRKRLSDGKIGKKHSKIHSNKGVKREGWMNEEIKRKISKSNKNKTKPPRSEEHKEKLGSSQLGKSKGHKGRISPMRGKKHSIESREKARLNNLMKNAVPILQYDMNGNFVKKWNKASDAISVSKGIFNCLKGKSKFSGNFIWEYWKENFLLKLNLEWDLDIPIIQEIRGNIIKEWESFYHLPKEMQNQDMVKCLIGEHKTYRNNIYKFKT